MPKVGNTGFVGCLRCTSTSSTTVIEDTTIPIVAASNDGPLTCTKTSVTLTASGGGNYTWAGGGMASTKAVTTPGTYTCLLYTSDAADE